AAGVIDFNTVVVAGGVTPHCPVLRGPKEHRMADVLLVYPKAGHDVRGVSVNAPLALLSVASTLVPDYSVQILDQRACDDFWGELERAIRQAPLLIGITSMTGTQIYHGLE